MKAVVLGLAGPTMTQDERAFFREAAPWGFIVFRRNIESPTQLAGLCAELRALSGREDLPILVDQEGGRVQRLSPPHWPAYPPAARFGALYDADPAAGLRAATLAARLMADDLVKVGLTVDCLPVLDVRQKETHQAIGDRAYGDDPTTVAALGRAVAEAMLAGGVLPVIKHMPGHGRATADSHFHLPRVSAPRAALESVDFAAFRALADLPLGMSAHVVFDAIDPEQPATTSKIVIGEIIRGAIGFDGLLMTDDLSMKALSGDFAARTKAALDAGCDLALHCNGDRKEAEAVVAAAPELGGKAAERAGAALARRQKPAAFDRAKAEEDLAALFAPGA